MIELTDEEATTRLNRMNHSLRLPKVTDSNMRHNLPILEALVERVMQLEREVYGYGD